MSNKNLVLRYIDDCRNKYKGFYDYTFIDIDEIKQVTHTKVQIVCPEHGSFYQNLYNHLHCVCPCPLCRKGIYSKAKDKNKIQTLIQDKIEHGVIYCYTDKTNGKKYIGQTISEKRRIIEHLRQTQKYKTVFDKVLQKKGIENFDYDILFEIEEKRSKISGILNEKEEYYIKRYNSQVPNGYNVSKGGKSILRMNGYKPTKETLKKMRDSHLGKPNPFKGKHYSDEQRKDILQKKHKTMSRKYNNGYIPQRKSIIVFKKSEVGFRYYDTFPNAKEIERKIDIDYKTIHYAISKKCPLEDNFIFINEKLFNSDPSIINYIQRQKSIKRAVCKYVKCIDKDGSANIYTLKEATAIYGRHVSECCDGKRKTTKGNKFEWYQNGRD